VRLQSERWSSFRVARGGTPWLLLRTGAGWWLERARARIAFELTTGERIGVERIVRESSDGTLGEVSSPRQEGQRGQARRLLGAAESYIDLLSEKNLIETIVLTLALLVICVLVTTQTPYFLTRSNLFVILDNVSVAGIIAVPAVFLLISGNVDLSVGGIATLSGLTISLLSEQHVAPSLSFTIALLVGVAIGLANAILVTVFKINSIIATLGMYIILPAIALMAPITDPLYGFSGLGIGHVIGIPAPVVVLLAVFGVGWVVLRFSRFGRHTYAVGANREVARLSGISTRRMVATLFLLSGLMSALAGVVQTAQVGGGDPNGNTLLMFYVLTAVILGGSGLEGGRGSMIGALVGLLLLGVIDNALVLMNVAPEWGQVVRGGLLLVAVGVSGVHKLRAT
jgi:ribose transport system permease protein